MSCPKKILLVFAGLLALAFLFVPYHLRSVTYKKDAYSRMTIRTTFHESGFMFLPQYLMESRKKYPGPGSGEKYYALNKNLLIMEIAVIFFLGGLDYCVFCLFLRKRKARTTS
jgi:hypothetical protein